MGFETDTQNKVAMARAAGVPDDIIYQRVLRDQAVAQQKSQTNTAQPAEQGFLARNANIIGSILGGVGGFAFGGPVGAVAGAAAGGSAGEAYKEHNVGQPLSAKDILTQGAIGGVSEFVGGQVVPRIIGGIGTKLAARGAVKTAADVAAETGGQAITKPLVNDVTAPLIPRVPTGSIIDIHAPIPATPPTTLPQMRGNGVMQDIVPPTETNPFGPHYTKPPVQGATEQPGIQLTPSPVKPKITTPTPIPNQSPQQIQDEITALKDTIANNPATALGKYANKNGTLPEVTGTGPSIFGKTGDVITQAHGFNDSEQARTAYEQLQQQKALLAQKTTDLAAAKKANVTIPATPPAELPTSITATPAPVSGATDVLPATPVAKPPLLTQTGNAIRSGVNGVDVPASPFAASETARLNNVADNVLQLKGSAAAKYSQLESKFTALDNHIKPIVNKSTATISRDEIMSAITNSPSRTLDERSLKTVNEALDRITNPDGNISIQDLFKYKQSLGGDIGKTFGKNTLTPAQETSIGAWQSAANAIAKAEPAVAKMTSLQHDIYTLSKGLDKRASGKTFIPFAHVGIPSGQIQAVQDLTGRTLQTTGAATASGTLGAAVLGSTLKQMIGHTLADQNNDIPATPPPDLNAALQGQNTIAAAANTNQGAAALGGLDANKIVQLMALAAAQGNQKALSQLNMLYQAVAAQTKVNIPAGLTKAQIDKQTSLNTALSSLDAAEQNLVTAGGAKGVIGGGGAAIPVIGQYLNPRGAAYHATKIELATQMAKAITGGARPAATVINYYMHSLPDVNDTKAFAADKIAKLRNELMAQARSFQLHDILAKYGEEPYSNTIPNSPSEVNLNDISQQIYATQ